MNISKDIKQNTLILSNLRFPSGECGTLCIRSGLIERREAQNSQFEREQGAVTLDCAGALVLPALVDGHMHLDKTMYGTAWFPQQAGPTRQSRIDTEKRLRRTLPPVEFRARNLVEACLVKGTTAIRTHVDIDPDIGLSSLHALCAVRDEFVDQMDIQIVAFPQSGVLSCPGTAELLSAAMTEGADLVGGIDPGSMDGDMEGQLDVIFDIAARHEVGVDIHLHDSSAGGLDEIMAVTARAAALGPIASVTISHGFALGAADQSDFDRTAAAMAAAGVSFVTHGGGAAVAPPVKALRAHGVEVFAGSDNVRDLWSPYGDGDMLARAMLLGWRCGFRNDDDLAVALECVSVAGARALGLPRHGLEPGDRADLFTVPVGAPAEAVVSHPARALVIKNGRVVAENGVLVSL